MSLDAFLLDTWSATNTTNWSKPGSVGLEMIGRRVAGSDRGHQKRVIRLDFSQAGLVSDARESAQIRVAAGIGVESFRSGGESLVDDASEHPALTDTFESTNRPVTGLWSSVAHRCSRNRFDRKVDRRLFHPQVDLCPLN
jgi:hypothetical protein